PNAVRLIEGISNDIFSVGAEGRTHHRSFVPPKRRSDRLAGFGVPKTRGLVIGPRKNARAVGAERHAVHCVVMTPQRLADWLTRRGVPQARRFIPRCGGNA